MPLVLEFSMRRQVAPRPALGDRGGAIGKSLRLDRIANILHEPLVVGEVVPAEQHGAERLAGFHQMVEVGA